MNSAYTALKIGVVEKFSVTSQRVAVNQYQLYSLQNTAVLQKLGTGVHVSTERKLKKELLSPKQSPVRSCKPERDILKTTAKTAYWSGK